MVTVFPMTTEMIDQVAAIDVACFTTEKWSRNLIAEELLDSRKHYFVAYIENEVVGFCGYAQVLDEGEIMTIAVREGNRKNGIGALLLQKAIEDGAARGINAFTLEVRESNVIARKMYEKAGFSCVGVRKNYYGTEDACIYWYYR